MNIGRNDPTGQKVKSDYSGFTVSYSPAGRLSYYEQAKKDIRDKPFESRMEEEAFAIPLDRWGSFRNQIRDQARQHYRISPVFTVEQARQNALFSVEIENSRGEKVAIILTSSNINQFETDAAVNAANETLLGGGGCDHEIHHGAGPLLVRECAYLNGCEVGQAVLTKGYDLPANYVIHTVGPLLIEGERPDEKALYECYRSCLEVCENQQFKSVVFPCIACGFYAFPINVAARVVKDTVKLYIERFGHHLDTIIFSLPKETQQEAYLKVFS
jgi:O-acetyl-ADP-ribose deacetylase